MDNRTDKTSLRTLVAQKVNRMWAEFWNRYSWGGHLDEWWTETMREFSELSRGDGVAGYLLGQLAIAYLHTLQYADTEGKSQPPPATEYRTLTKAEAVDAVQGADGITQITYTAGNTSHVIAIRKEGE